MFRELYTLGVVVYAAIAILIAAAISLFVVGVTLTLHYTHSFISFIIDSFLAFIPPL